MTSVNTTNVSAYTSPLRNSNDGGQGSNGKVGEGQNETKKISVFATLDTNSSNGVEKSEANQKITEGFDKNRAQSIFSNVMSGVSGQDAPAIKSKMSSVDISSKLQSMYDTAANAFKDIQLAATSVDEGTENQEEAIKSARGNLDSQVTSDLNSQISSFNNTAADQATNELKAELETVTKEVQEERVNNTYSDLDGNQNHTIDSSEAQPKMSLDANVDIKGMIAGLDTSDAKNVSSQINNLLSSAMQTAMSSFSSVDAKMGVPEDSAAFNGRVEGSVNSQISSIQNAYTNEVTSGVAQIQQSVTSSAKPAANTQTTNTDQYNATHQALDQIGARFSRTEVNGKMANVATMTDDKGNMQKMMLNKDGSTEKIAEGNKDGPSNATQNVIDAQKDAMSALKGQAGVKNLQFSNPTAFGNDITGTYQDNDSRNHAVTIKAEVGSNGAKVNNNITGSDQQQNEVYNKAEAQTGVSKSTLDDLNITAEMKGDQVIYRDEHGQLVSEEEIMQHRQDEKG